MTPAAAARVEQARALIETEGLTFTQAAERLDTTRNAIIGLAHRHGIQSPNRPGWAVVHGMNRQKPRAKAAQARAEAKARPAELPQPAIAPSAAWLALPGSTPVLLEHHREHTCKWPLGQSPMLFCALPVELDPTGLRTYNYCPAHHAMGTKPIERKPK